MLRSEMANADQDSLGKDPLWDIAEQALYWGDSHGLPSIGSSPASAAPLGRCPSTSARSVRHS